MAPGSLCLALTAFGSPARRPHVPYAQSSLTRGDRRAQRTWHQVCRKASGAYPSSHMGDLRRGLLTRCPAGENKQQRSIREGNKPATWGENVLLRDPQSSHG